MTLSGTDKSHFWIYARNYPEINRLISIFGREHSPPNIYSGQAIVFSHMLWIHLEWKWAYISQVRCVFSLSLSTANTLTQTHHNGIYSSSALANCCVWLSLRVWAGRWQVMFYFCANLNNIKCRRQATSPIEQPAEVGEPQKLYCLLGKRRRMEEAREQVRLRETSERVRDGNRIA